MTRLAEVGDSEPDALDNAVTDDADARPTPLAQLRKSAVIAVLRAEGASSVVDLGCGVGALLRDLVPDPTFSRVLGVDVSHRALELAARRLHLDRMPDRQRARLELVQSSAVYRDDRLLDYDAVVLMEVARCIWTSGSRSSTLPPTRSSEGAPPSSPTSRRPNNRAVASWAVRSDYAEQLSWSPR